MCNAGDIRISYMAIAPTSVSVLARQIDNEGHLGQWLASNGFDVTMLYEGQKSADEMIQAVLSHSKVLAWILRSSMILWALACTHAITPLGSLGYGYLTTQCVCFMIILYGLICAALWHTSLGLFALSVGALGLFATTKLNQPEDFVASAPPSKLEKPE